MSTANCDVNLHKFMVKNDWKLLTLFMTGIAENITLSLPFVSFENSGKHFFTDCFLDYYITQNYVQIWS